MRRRDFIKALAGSTANWPPVARAQGERMRRIGVLMEFVEHDREGKLDTAAFGEGLCALNWKEGRNPHIDWRWERQ